MRNIFFDASAYAAGLNAAYDATQTHFSFLDDSEIQGGGAWMAQAGENLHVTIQSDDNPRTKVAHYFYKKATTTWRCHLKNAASPIPYGAHVHVNLQAVQAKAIDFAWPPVQFVFKKSQAEIKKARRLLQQAKETQRKELLDEAVKQKSIERPGPPSGRVTAVYIQDLINRNDEETLVYLYKSPQWPLSLWDGDAWSTMMLWLTR